tara:strand:+ start:389 stop:910 length:522 start_codon:yes stop_codon:yes gene_type:complete
MGTKRVGWARIKSLINENNNLLQLKRVQVKEVSSATTLTEADSGSTIVWTKGSAHDITLPAAKEGLHFTVKIAVGATANHYIKTASTADVFYGKAVINTSDATEAAPAVQIVTKASGLSGTIDRIHLHKSNAANGGQAGDTIEITCVDDTYWLVDARLTTSNGTPNAAAVLIA